MQVDRRTWSQLSVYELIGVSGTIPGNVPYRLPWRMRHFMSNNPPAILQKQMTFDCFTPMDISSTFLSSWSISKNSRIPAPIRTFQLSSRSILDSRIFWQDSAYCISHSQRLRTLDRLSSPLKHFCILSTHLHCFQSTDNHLSINFHTLLFHSWKQYKMRRYIQFTFLAFYLCCYVASGSFIHNHMFKHRHGLSARFHGSAEPPAAEEHLEIKYVLCVSPNTMFCWNPILWCQNIL